ncbi:hypothetical protein D3C83_08140 [compost metagenome]
MWVLQPFRIRAHDRAAGARRGDRFFEIVRIPFRNRLGDGVRVGFALEHADHPVVKMGQVEMRQIPAAVLGAPRLRDGTHMRHERRIHHFPIASGLQSFHELRALAGGPRMTDVDGDFLALAGLHLVDVGDRDADAGEDVRRRLADLEARGKDRVIARDRHFAVRGHAATAKAHDFFESGVH